jgi:hypothetical protein
MDAGSADHRAKLTKTDIALEKRQKLINSRAKEKHTILNPVDLIEFFRAAFAPHSGRPFS